MRNSVSGSSAIAQPKKRLKKKRKKSTVNDLFKNHKAKREKAERDMRLIQDDKTIPSLLFKKVSKKSGLVKEDYKMMDTFLMEHNENYNFFRSLTAREKYLDDYIDSGQGVAIAKIKGCLLHFMVRLRLILGRCGGDSAVG